MNRRGRQGDEKLPLDPDLGPDDLSSRPAHDPPNRRDRGRTGRRADPGALAAIALGGALGTPARYGMAQVVHVSPDTFPWATFWTNATGSFALGVFLAVVAERFPPSSYLRPFVATGFLGAYTTYSTFAVETVLLARHGRPGVSLAYAGASVSAGLLAAWAGIRAGRGLPLEKTRGAS